MLIKFIFKDLSERQWLRFSFDSLDNLYRLHGVKVAPFLLCYFGELSFEYIVLKLFPSSRLRRQISTIHIILSACVEGG